MSLLNSVNGMSFITMKRSTYEVRRVLVQKSHSAAERSPQHNSMWLIARCQLSTQCVTVKIWNACLVFFSSGKWTFKHFIVQLTQTDYKILRLLK